MQCQQNWISSFLRVFFPTFKNEQRQKLLFQRNLLKWNGSRKISKHYYVSNKLFQALESGSVNDNLASLAARAVWATATMNHIIEEKKTKHHSNFHIHTKSISRRFNCFRVSKAIHFNRWREKWKNTLFQNSKLLLQQVGNNSNKTVANSLKWNLEIRKFGNSELSIDFMNNSKVFNKSLANTFWLENFISFCHIRIP